MGSNFVRTMLRLGAERDELRVVADQLGSPTAAPDLAEAIAAVLARIRQTGWQGGYRGMFHGVAQGAVSWHGFAEAIFAASALARQPKVLAIATADYPTRARRPADGRLDSGRLAQVFGSGCRPQDGLARVMARLMAV